jgi:hypothetical protein
MMHDNHDFGCRPGGIRRPEDQQPENQSDTPMVIYRRPPTPACPPKCGCYEECICRELREIECLIRNPIYGLREIKTEVYQIGQELDSGTYGLAEIKTEVY